MSGLLRRPVLARGGIPLAATIFVGLAAAASAAQAPLPPAPASGSSHEPVGPPTPDAGTGKPPTSVDGAPGTDAGPSAPRADAGTSQADAGLEENQPGAATDPCQLPTARTTDAAWKAACDKVCGTGTLCLRADTGEFACDGDDDQTEVAEGTTLTIKIVGPAGLQEACQACSEWELSTTQLHRLDRVFEKPKGKQAGESPPAFVPYKSLDVQASEDTEVRAIRATFSRRPKPKTTCSPQIDAVRDININHGHYYLSAGVLVPFVVNGSRSVTTSPVAGTSNKELRVEEDLHVTAALMLNVYPFGGRERGSVWSFSPDQFYFGAVFEPIAGLSANAGVAVLRGQFPPDGFEAGMLVTEGAPEPDKRYMARFYAGLTMSLDILDTMMAAKSAIAGKDFTQ